MRNRIGAFFDVDKTLIAENSGTLYVRHLWEQGEIDWRTASGHLLAYLRYKLNLLNVEEFAESTAADFAGRSEEELMAESRGWVDEVLLDLIYPEGRELVRKHLDAGHVVAFVSGATRYIVEPLAEHLGVEHTMHTRLEVRKGLFTGRLVQPVCFGEGKIYWLQQLIDHENIELAKSYFYTDSITDQPLLDLVGHPVVVNPDPLLYRLAVRRCWPVRIFSPAESFA